MVCQEELGKAVQIASEFRQKLSEEGHVKQDMLSQLLSERSTKAKQLSDEQAKVQKVSSILYDYLYQSHIFWHLFIWF